jgi:hypothetical protein
MEAMARLERRSGTSHACCKVCWFSSRTVLRRNIPDEIVVLECGVAEAHSARIGGISSKLSLNLERSTPATHDTSP